MRKVGTVMIPWYKVSSLQPVQLQPPILQYIHLSWTKILETKKGIGYWMVQNKKWWKKSGKVECFFCMVLIKVNQCSWRIIAIFLAKNSIIDQWKGTPKDATFGSATNKRPMINKFRKIESSLQTAVYKKIVHPLNVYNKKCDEKLRHNEAGRIYWSWKVSLAYISSVVNLSLLIILSENNP